jgi:hypothetical protein
MATEMEALAGKVRLAGEKVTGGAGALAVLLAVPGVGELKAA